MDNFVPEQINEIVGEEKFSNGELETRILCIEPESSGDTLQCGKYADLSEESTSYHELRCPSNEEFYNSVVHSLPVNSEEYEELFNNSFHNSNFYKFHQPFPEKGVNGSLENTDDQLFIEIVKEEVDSKPADNEETSIFDSISFSIDDFDEDSMTLIKITETIDDPPIYTLFEEPPTIIPEVKKKVRIKNHKKPLKLANYRNLITDAINSSPEKRMILTDIYQWIMEQVPFFKDDEKGSRNGWKNCVRHTLSVNERFIRIKNSDNCRYSYWTVCEDGDFRTKFAAYPWVSEAFKPEERKRVPRSNNRLKVKTDRSKPKRVQKQPVQKVNVISQQKQNLTKSVQNISQTKRSLNKSVQNVGITKRNSSKTVKSQVKRNLNKTLPKCVPQSENTVKVLHDKKENKIILATNEKQNIRVYKTKRKITQEIVAGRRQSNVDNQRTKREIKRLQTSSPLVMHVKRKNSKRKPEVKPSLNSKVMPRKQNTGAKISIRQSKRKLQVNNETLRKSTRKKRKTRR